MPWLIHCNVDLADNHQRKHALRTKHSEISREAKQGLDEAAKGIKRSLRRRYSQWEALSANVGKPQAVHAQVCSLQFRAGTALDPGQVCVQPGANM